MRNTQPKVLRIPKTVDLDNPSPDKSRNFEGKSLATARLLGMLDFENISNQLEAVSVKFKM
jgi:hypothetical protein